MMAEFPTQKQENYAKKIASTLGIALPGIRSKQAYSQFINDNVNAYKREQQKWGVGYYNWEDEALDG